MIDSVVDASQEPQRKLYRCFQLICIKLYCLTWQGEHGSPDLSMYMLSISSIWTGNNEKPE